MIYQNIQTLANSKKINERTICTLHAVKMDHYFRSDTPLFIKMGSSFVYGVLKNTWNNEWILNVGRPKQIEDLFKTHEFTKIT